MFSIAAMPRTSVAPMPPTPIQATLSLSLGATWRRPRTCEGTMVKAAVVEATSPTKVRRSIGLSLGITVSVRGSVRREYCRGRSPATRMASPCRCWLDSFAGDVEPEADGEEQGPIAGSGLPGRRPDCPRHALDEIRCQRQAKGAA